MMLVTILIIIILLLCIKTLVLNLGVIRHRGEFSNTVLVDVAGIRQNYGLTSLASGINYRSDTLDSYQTGYGDNDEDGGDEGGGNFTNRYRRDPRYLEDVMNDDCWSEVCLNELYSGKVVGKTCNPKCSINPGPGYVRTFGDVQITYNDDITDSGFKNTQLKKDGIYVPWSETYNNISPANPSIR